MEFYSRRIKNRKWSVLVISLVMAGFIITFGYEDDVSAKTTELKKVTIVLDWVVNTNHTGIYVAKDHGYFKDEGLDVAIEFPPEIGAESLVVSGTAQFGISHQEAVTLARVKGVKLKALAAIIQHNTSGFAARKTAAINRPKDFEGKTYGGWGSPIEVATLKALMERDNGDYNKIKQVSIGSMGFFAATSAGIDFVWIFQGWDGVAAKIRGIDISFISLREMEPALDYYTPLIIASDKYIARHPDIVRKFIKALARGYEFCIENPEKAADILLASAPELDRKLVVGSQKFLAGQYKADAPRWGEMKLSVWINYANWLDKYNQLEGVFEPESAFTNEFLPE